MASNPFVSAGDTGDAGSIPELGRFPGEGKGNLLQGSCLENCMDRGLQFIGSQTVRHDWASHTGIEQGLEG